MATKVKQWVNTPEVRAWAKENGYEVSDRGRLNSEVIRAFNQEHRPKGIGYLPQSRDMARVPDADEASENGKYGGLNEYRQRREPKQDEDKQEQPVEAKAEEAPEPQRVEAQTHEVIADPLGGTPAVVREMLRATKQPVVVVFMPTEQLTTV